MHLSRKLSRILFCLTLSVTAALASCSLSSRANIYPDQKSAVLELKQAVEHNDKEQIAKVLGPGSETFFDTGDTELDRTRANIFVEKFNEFHDLKPAENNQYHLVLGKKRWPFPAPLVEKNGKWGFDFEQGKQAIEDRIIGSNELSAMSVLETIFYAQQDFYRYDLDNNNVADYATRIVSTEDKTDGLYWEHRETDKVPSPLAGLLSKATEAGYEYKRGQQPKPYRGYYFKLLKSESPDKFTALAYPASWGNSGYMSFIINEQGWIYQKNLTSDFHYSESIVLDQGWERLQ